MSGRILIVADDTNLQRLLGEALRRDGHEVIDAADGPAGLSRWAADRPHLVIVDAVLPGMDGFGVVERIRASEGPGAHVPVIMVGSAANAAAKIHGLRIGADDFLTKPIHPAEFRARTRSLLARFGVRERPSPVRTTRGQVHGYYGAKGGVGTTTIAINAAIAFHRELGRKVCLVDGNLQFGDHRVFLDLGLDRKSIVDIVTAPSIDADLIRNVMVKHDSGIDLLLAPPSPETAELVRPEHLPFIADQLSSMYDYILVDVDKRLDDVNLGVFETAEIVFVVMTADLSCLKNVRLILETMNHLGYPPDKVQLVLNRSNAFTGINVKNAEGALRRTIEHQVVNEYRGAISALNSGAPFMFTKADSPLGASLLQFVRGVDKVAAAALAQPVGAR